ncbi:MAG: RNA ligase family protein [Myxococcota bacterium]
MRKFTHIDQFYQVIRYVAATNGNPDCPERYKIRGPVEYRGSVKLHGSNAGVACRPNGLLPQSRSRALSVDDDNYGFAAFVARASVEAAVREIESTIRQERGIADEVPMILFGEWIGPGLQKGVAVNQLPQKQWVLFAVKVFSSEEGAYLDAVPTIGDRFAEEQIFSIADGPSFRLEVDFASADSKEAALETATKHTEEVERRCPWAMRFGIEGVGEGIVWVPLGDHWGNSDLFFKTKGSKHKVTKSKSGKPQLAPEVLASIRAFVDFAVTDNRLEQGLDHLREMGQPIDMPSIGAYLKWVGQDVKREAAAELEVNQLEWKDVSKAVTARARAYFVASVERAALKG